MPDVAEQVVVASPDLFHGELKRCVSLRGLTMISLGSIIGSGWLLGALGAATAAGPASLLSWILAGGILGVLALVHAELGAAYPLSGGTARFPFLGFGALGGFTGGWMAWIQAVTIAPIEVEAALTYLESTSLHPGWVHANGTLSGWGIVVAGIAMALFTFINVMGVRWLAESNNITMIWKLAVPTLTIIVLLIVSFTGSNFSAGGGFMPFGAKGVFAALPLGVVFALQGFEQAIQIAGESRDPQHDIHRAVIISMIIGVIIYLLLEVAFIGAINPKDVLHSWNNPIPGQGAFGPYASLATAAGVGWLATILYIDAVISPAGTGLVYSGTSARTTYALSRVGYVPPALGQVDKRGVPFVSLIFCWVIGMLVFLPFPSWAGMVGLVTTATVLMYAMAPVSLAALRRSDPDRPRPYRLPAAKFLAPLSFVCANFIVYWAGWNVIFWLYIFIIAGFVVFFVYQAVAPPGRKLKIHWRNAAWIPP
ncbi:MAG: APC family permease, partial [Solirubrobacterales bacterium]|nr:APC family permease [Solirubrobacterales bacterium]